MIKLVAFFESLPKLPKMSLYALVFLLPLWFLPLTQDALAYQKQTLLIILGFVSLIVWLGHSSRQKTFQYSDHIIGAGVLAVIFASAIATVFSLWIYGSFWGLPFDVSDSFLTMIFFGILYFLISNIIDTAEELLRFLFILVVSGAIAGAYALLQAYGLFIIPLSITKNTAFNTLGSPSSIAVLSAILLPIALTMAFTVKSRLKWICAAAVAIFFSVMVLIGVSVAWLALAGALAIMVGFGFFGLKKKLPTSWLSLSMVLLAIALFFSFAQVSFPGSPSLSIEVLPNPTAQLNIIKNLNLTHLIFGTGPGTFILDYAQYHQTSLNQTAFWGTRFSSGASYVLDFFITRGLLGGCLLIITIIAGLFFAGKSLMQSKATMIPWITSLSVAASFVAVTISQIFYNGGFVVVFVFWVLLGALVVSLAKPKKTVLLASSPMVSIISSSLFLLVLIFGVSLLFVQGKKYVAEVQYSQGSVAFANGDIKLALLQILSAANANRSVDMYWRDLAQLYLMELNQISADKTLSDADKSQQIQVVATNAATVANQAVVTSPLNVENWNVRGFVYRNLIGVPNADTLAIESYTKAGLLEPASPFSFTELGRVYLIKAQAMTGKADAERQQVLVSALENLDKALVLKSDYSPALYLTALVYGMQGKTNEEIAKLEATKLVAPSDIGLAFQLGVIYYQQKDFVKAQGEFERIKELNPDYANGRYMLGLVYDRQSKQSKAISEFTRVLELNPDNAQVKQILNNLKNNKPALTGLDSGSSLVSDNPSEIKTETKTIK